MVTEPDSQPAVAVTARPLWTPRLAWLAGYMPLRSTGVDSFRLARPSADGRGVLIAILDTGVDPSVPGLQRTTTGERKVLDARDFSGEGGVALELVMPDRSGAALVGGRWIRGFGRLAARARPPFFAGLLEERRFGVGAAADLNGNGRANDRYTVAVAKGTAGWFAIVDVDADADLDTDPTLHDYLVAGELLRLPRPDGAPGPSALAVNLQEENGKPALAFVVDNSGHGTHVAGIAAGHDLFDVDGFDGVAPGAQLLGLKISDNARGGISVTGSMLRALNYAADFALRRRLPLVVNLSYGVGHGVEGTAAIDSIVDEFALKHPDVPVVVSVGNDGPGLSSTWLPASAEHSIAVCGLLPGVFARAPSPGVPAEADRVRWWSSRGGEVTKPDVCAPGIAYSSVPAWRAGEEISDGTSMAAPHVAGVAALLLSAARQEGRQPRAIDIKRALTNSAVAIPGTTVLDAGSGIVNVPSAMRWLMTGHLTGVYTVRALGPGGEDSGVPGAYWRDGLTPADTLQRFHIRSVGGQPAARLHLVSDAGWIRAPEILTPNTGLASVTIQYDRTRLVSPGVYVGTVWAIPASDTLAGPSFGLTSTVVVPHELDRSLSWEGWIEPGGIERYPIRVADGTGGLVVTLSARDSAGATVHVFEPDGRPYRETRSAGAGGGQHPTARVDVLASDIEAGTYEVVVAAPPATSVRYRLEVTEPTIRVEEVDERRGSVSLVVVDEGVVRGTLQADWLGAREEHTIESATGGRQSVTVRPPTWARGLLLEARVDSASWRLITDFGVTMFDSTGAIVSAGPLAYIDKRGFVSLDSTVSGPIEVELAPAFAHLEPAAWSARLAITYIPDEAQTLAFDTLGTRVMEVEVSTDPSSVRIPRPVDLPPTGPGRASVVEVRMTDDRGVTGRWRGTVWRRR